MWFQNGKKRVQYEGGFTLVEIIIVIVLLGIAVFPLGNLIRRNLLTSLQSEQISKASFFAQQKMEQIVGDYKNTNDADITASNYNDSLDGMTCTVTRDPATAGQWNTLNGVNYITVTVTVSEASIPDITLNMWLVQ